MTSIPPPPVKKLIFVLCGRKRAGKSTVARWLALSFGVRVVSIMAPLRQITKEIFRLDDDQIEGPRKDEWESGMMASWGTTPRTLMIQTSRAIKNALGERVWVDRAMTLLDGSDHNFLVLDGVRPALEVDALRAHYAGVEDVDLVVIRVVCTTDPIPEHEDEIDATVDQVVPDLTIEAERTPDDSGVNVAAAALDTVVRYLEAQPWMSSFFDPGEEADAAKAPLEVA